ncbi:hypothetical protein L1887_16180 [Cichorium endivia]|nr:hypothetical protein L1887_16180 [Cichorium endivia]
MGKVGVITSRRKWINEEIVVFAAGQIYRIGVVEYTDDWSPFRACPYDKAISDDEEDDVDDDSEAISKTWVNMEEDEPEEGEIHPDDKRMNEEGRKKSCMENNKKDDREFNSPEVPCRIEVDNNRSSAVESPILEESSRNSKENGLEKEGCASVHVESVVHENDECEDTSLSQSVDEVNETFAIGNELGFQIEQRNVLIIQSIGDNGDHNNKQ